ncbi:hypothetical protein F5888DRAFT_1604423 [Russula emetica]|nr:hypothetical protein F5888DRAFT_1604423 [Russula emetica]
MLLCKLPAFFGFGTTLTLGLLLLLPVVPAHPIWHDLNSRSSIDSFITGSTFLLAGGIKFGGVPYYLTTPLPSGTKTLYSDDGAPLFVSVHNGQLLHHTNESHFLYVNAMNVTQDMNGSPLFRLTLASQRDGLLDAVWRWRGECLYLDDGQKSNKGLYYKCVSTGGEGIYTSFDM